MWKSVMKDVKHIKGPIPSNENALCKGMIKQIIPDIDPNVLNELVATRSVAKPLAVETSLDIKDVKAAAETCDDKDQSSFEAVLTDLVHGKVTRSGVAKGRASGSKAVAKPLLKHVVVDASLTAERARVYLPPVPHCRIEKDTNFHFRWQGYYERPKPKQRYVGQGLGVSSDVEALRYVLIGLWAFHKLETDEDCPYDFTAEF
jgi:hypothetical protein